MLDFDLAEMYGIETRVLKQAVRRNPKRFERNDFMFELTKEELSRAQFVTLNKGRGNNFKYMPFAFTELGVAMLSSVLNSDIAIEINRNNDFSENTQKSLDDIYIALSELATKKKNNAKRPKIGYIK